VWTAPAWSIAANAAVSAPGLSAEKLAGGDFEAAASDGWTFNGALTERSEEQVHAGTYSRKNTGTVNQGVYKQYTGPTTQKWFLVSGWLYVTTGSAAVAAAGALSPSTAAAAWNRAYASRRYTTNAWCAAYAAAAGSTFYVDDLSCRELVTADLFATLDTGKSDNFVVSAALTCGLTQSAGLVACLDSAANPQNYVLAHYDAFKVSLDKVVAGVATNLLFVTTTYAAGARLAVEKQGTTFRVFYNGALIGTPQTIADAGIVSNTRHGLFNTVPTNTLEDFRARRAPVKTVSVIGDSICESLAAGDWPRDLVRSAEVGAVLLKGHAVSGQSIMAHMDAQTVAAASDAADVIIVALGTNDTDNAGITAEYTENLQELQASNAGAAIYCMGILPKTAAGARAANNARIEAAAAAAGATYWSTDGWIDPATDTSDGLHPNAGGAAKILTEVLARVRL
jgi:lysophospholipase L1-like esterase